MKGRRNSSNRASTLQVALSTSLISIFAILFAIAAPIKLQRVSQHDSHQSQQVAAGDAESITALGNYPDTSVTLSGNTTVTPDATPTNTTSISVSTNTNFKGTFAASPTTGVVTVTDAHPAGTYTVTMKAFGTAGTATKTFTLTVNRATPCAPPAIDGFLNAPDVSAGDSPIGIAIGDFNGDG